MTALHRLLTLPLSDRRELAEDLAIGLGIAGIVIVLSGRLA